jgi:site-specific DNA recombinase
MTTLNRKKHKFCIYVRKSQNREDKQIASNESQILELQSFARKMKISVDRIYEDAASAHIPRNRPAFKEMLIALEKGEIDGVLTWKADRLARNMIDAGEIIHLFQIHGFNVIQTPYRCYLPNDNMLTLIIEMGMANQYSLDLSKNVKRGNKTKIEKGGFCGKAPLGYKNCKETRSVIKDSLTFNNVKQLFLLYGSGTYSISQLETLCKDKWQLKSNKSKQFLTAATIYKILNNPFYYGKVIWGEMQHMGSHPKMVSYSEFQQVQEILRQSGRSANTNYEFAYTGLLTCGECGSGITAQEKVKYKCPECKKKQTAKHSKKCTCGYKITKQDISKAKRYVYYHCSKSKGVCSQKFANATILDEQFEYFITKLQANKDFFDWSKKWLTDIKQNIDVQHKKLEKEYQLQAKELDAKLSNLLELKINGEIENDLFQKKKMEIIEKQKELEEKPKQNLTLLNTIENEISLLVNLQNQFKNSEPKDKKHLLQKLTSNPILMDKKLLIQAKKPYLTLQTLRKHKNLNIEPALSQSTKGIKGDIQACSSLWYTLVKEFETFL